MTNHTGEGAPEKLPGSSIRPISMHLAYLVGLLVSQWPTSVGRAAMDHPLGHERAKLVRDVLALSEKRGLESGYCMDSLGQRTEILFPYQRGDKVVFARFTGKPPLLTCWERRGNRLVRCWQIRAKAHPSKDRPFHGTLANWIAKDSHLPLSVPDASLETLRSTRPFAVYTSQSIPDTFTSGIVHPNGSYKDEDSFVSSLDHVDRHGYPILDEELRWAK